MPVSQGAIIAAAHYNAIRANVTTLMSMPVDATPTYGYGLTPTSSSVSGPPTANTITQAQWQALKNDIILVANHQGISSNANILALTNLVLTQNSTIVSNTHVSTFENAYATIEANRLLSNELSEINTTANVTVQRTTQWGSPTTPRLTHKFTLSWTNINYARAFFNAGGAIRFTPTLGSPYSNTTQVNDWISMFNRIGTIVFGSNFTKSINTTVPPNTNGGGTINVQGFNNLPFGTQTQVYTRGGGISGSRYSANDYTIFATSSLSGATFILTFEIQFNDDAKNQAGYDYVDGVLTHTIKLNVTDGSYVDHYYTSSPFIPTATVVTSI